MKKRLSYRDTWKRLSDFKQMIFIAGPRQSGKTTFAKEIARQFSNSLYFNWDIIEDKRRLVENPSFYEEVNRKDDSLPLIIFDEIHKHPDWKNYLKSVYDKNGENFKFLVSGSGRLDIFRKGGDSLAGRYLLFYLFPFTLSELNGQNIPFSSFMENPLQIPKRVRKESKEIWKNLGRFSGFPDPFLKGQEEYYRLWSRNYLHQLLREDIRNLVHLRKFDNVEILYSLLPGRVGSPLSMDSLARDIQVSFDSVKKWLTLFENFFLLFSIAPWTKKISRALSKEKKIYLYNYGTIKEEGVKFENMVALELRKAVTGWNDLGLGEFTLHYIRNKEKEEVDFLLCENRLPFLLVECKLSDQEPAKPLKKFQKLLGIPAVQLVNGEEVYKIFSNGSHKILVITAHRWLAGLPCK